VDAPPPPPPDWPPGRRRLAGSERSDDDDDASFMQRLVSNSSYSGLCKEHPVCMDMAAVARYQALKTAELAIATSSFTPGSSGAQVTGMRVLQCS
jgi:hypothetical protein